MVTVKCSKIGSEIVVESDGGARVCIGIFGLNGLRVGWESSRGDLEKALVTCKLRHIIKYKLNCRRVGILHLI
jgi:hypothetical protein